MDGLARELANPPEGTKKRDVANESQARGVGGKDGIHRQRQLVQSQDVSRVMCRNVAGMGRLSVGLPLLNSSGSPFPRLSSHDFPEGTIFHCTGTGTYYIMSGRHPLKPSLRHILSQTSKCPHQRPPGTLREVYVRRVGWQTQV